MKELNKTTPNCLYCYYGGSGSKNGGIALCYCKQRKDRFEIYGSKGLWVKVKPNFYIDCKYFKPID